jgi:hypothetical protein
VANATLRPWTSSNFRVWDSGIFSGNETRRSDIAEPAGRYGLPAAVMQCVPAQQGNRT